MRRSLTFAALLNTGLNRPTGLTFDGTGNPYAANAGDNTIQRFTTGASAASSPTPG